MEVIQFSDAFKNRARVISDYVQQSCHDDYRFVEKGLEDIHFSEAFKNQG